jgi:hypothetical protein
MDKDISKLPNVVLDRKKLAELINQTSPEYVGQLLAVKTSQVYNLRRGVRTPTVDGLLRLMMLYNLKPEEITTIK